MAAGIITTVEVPAPIEVVWERLADVGAHAEWMSDATSVEFLDDVRSGVGTTIRVRTRVGPLHADDVMRFDRWDPPRRMAVTHVGRIEGTGEFRLDSVRNGTLVTWNEKLRFPWYMGGPLAGLAARPVLRRIFRSNLERFAASFL